MKKRKPRKITIKDLVAESHSRGQVNKIIIAVSDDLRRFNELMKVFLGEDEELARRAAWAISYIVIKHPQFVTRWFPKVLANLRKPDQHPAIYRNSFRFLEVIPIPEVHAAAVLDAAFYAITNAAYPVAIRAFAMTTAMNVVRGYPDLIDELQLVVNQLSAENSPAIRSRSRRILADIAKLRNSPN